MRLILLPLCVFATTAAAPIAVPPYAMLPGYTQPAERWTSLKDALRGRDCAETIRQVPEDAEQPKLDREPATPEKPLMIAAVDKRVDGCAVMQMHRQIDDLRPVPQPTMGPARMQPAR